MLNVEFIIDAYIYIGLIRPTIWINKSSIDVFLVFIILTGESCIHLYLSKIQVTLI